MQTTEEKVEMAHLRLWLSEALGHIETLCGADWSAGDNAESDRAQCFVRDVRGRYAPLRKSPTKVWITDPADGVLRLAKYDPQL